MIDYILRHVNLPLLILSLVTRYGRTSRLRADTREEARMTLTRNAQMAHIFGENGGIFIEKQQSKGHSLVGLKTLSRCALIIR